MANASTAEDLGLPVVGLGAEAPWPVGFRRGSGILVERGSRAVWTATDLGRKASASVVVAGPEQDGDPDALRNATSKLLEHAAIPGVLKVLQVDPAGRWAVLEPLAGFLSDLPALGWKLERKLALFAELCAMVQALHSRGVVHGALCPEAIALDEAFHPRLAALDAQGLVGNVANVAYLAPEVTRHGGADARSDVYALGRILGFLLHGQEPPLEKPLPVLTWLAKSPAGLSRIVRRATHEEPGLRYDRVHELAADVVRYGDFERVGVALANAKELNFTGLSKPPISGVRKVISVRQPVVQLPAPVTARPLPVRAAAAVAAALVVGVLVTFVSPVQATSRWLARRAVLTAEPAARGPALAHAASLGELEFPGLIAISADLSRAKLTSVTLAGGDLSDASLEGADLAGADLAGATLSGAKASGADLTGANVERALGLETVSCDDATAPPSGWSCRAGVLASEARAGQ